MHAPLVASAQAPAEQRKRNHLLKKQQVPDAPEDVRAAQQQQPRRREQHNKACPRRNSDAQIAARHIGAVGRRVELGFWNASDK